MARKAASADIALSAALAEREITASPRRIETARQWGLLGEAKTRALGRGKGSQSIRPADEIDRAQSAFELLDEVGDYPTAALTAFVRGDSLSKDRLERAYAASFRQLSTAFGRRFESHQSPIDKALAIATPLAEHLKKGRAHQGLRDRLRGLGLANTDVPLHRAILDYTTDLVQIMLGVEPESTDADRVGASLQQFVETETALVDALPPESGLPVSKIVPIFSLNSLLSLVRSATLGELEIAREHSLALRAFGRQFGPLAQLRFGRLRAYPWMLVGEAPDMVVAWLVPGMVWLRRLHGAQMESTLGYLEQWTPFFETANLFLANLPEPVRIIVATVGGDHLSEDQRHHAALRFAELKAANPELMQLLENPPPTPEIVR